MSPYLVPFQTGFMFKTMQKSVLLLILLCGVEKFLCQIQCIFTARYRTLESSKHTENTITVWFTLQYFYLENDQLLQS